MNDFNRITTWYRVVTQEVQTSQSSYVIWRDIHRVGQHMLPELLSVVVAAQDYANDPTSIERLHNLRQAIKRAQEQTT